MITAPDTAPTGPPWWRLLLRDPVLLMACAILAVLATAAAVLTAADRTVANRTAAHRAAADRAAAERAAAERAGADPVAGGLAAVSAEAGPRVSATVPPPLIGGALPDAGQAGPGEASSVGGTPERCPQSGALIRPGGLDAAMGLRTMELDLLNCGRRPYTVRGYPTVRVLGPARAPLSVEIVQGPSTIAVLPPVDDPPLRITLQPGERATAVLVWRTTAVAGPADRVTYLGVTARRGDHGQTVTPVRELDIGTGGRLGVGPWIRIAGD